VLVCTLGITILAATRDLAVALVDVTHLAAVGVVERNLVEGDARTLADEGLGLRVIAQVRSGGGKSTLFTLLQRFYDPQNGRILIDGQDIGRVTQRDVLRHDRDRLAQALLRHPADILAVDQDAAVLRVATRLRSTTPTAARCSRPSTSTSSPASASASSAARVSCVTRPISWPSIRMRPFCGS
jgi:ABC-type uncharacterized transport system YnjBCD ATPase subunit